MSHFSALVIVPKLGSREDMVAEATRLLAPFDENIQVEEYLENCYCVGNAAESESREQADGEFGGPNYFRSVYRQLPEAERTDERWKEMLAPYTERYEELIKAHPQFKKPDPECSECIGTGRHETTYNPQSRWDWHVIGGRWTGRLTDYKPHEDPINQEKCDLCDGTGQRKDSVYYKYENGSYGTIPENVAKRVAEAREHEWPEFIGNVTEFVKNPGESKELADLPPKTMMRAIRIIASLLNNSIALMGSRESVPYSQQKLIRLVVEIALSEGLPEPVKWCNGCEGKGTRVKFSYAAYEGDMQPMNLIKEFRPFALLTPDGEWHEKGKMRMFGMISDEKADENWEQEIVSIYAKYSEGYTGILYDLHI